MPTQTKYKQGEFSWIELHTTDTDAAKRFYSGLFGWTFDDVPMPEGMGTYTMAKLGDQHVGAITKLNADMAKMGVPPNWASYITVDNVDETTKKVSTNNGKVIKEPFDVMDVGRMAVVQDPSGATVCLWQAKKHIGAGVKGENGALCWNEVFTTNVDAAGKFYANTIGWKTEAVDMGPMGTYTLFKNGDDKNSNAGGMMPMPPNMKGVPSNWLAYIQVADCDVSAKKVSDLGGKVVMPPMDIPKIGRFAIVQDPAGATFALFKMGH
jgi:predicted enzyme related to lactoylglutathione lyase